MKPHTVIMHDSAYTTPNDLEELFSIQHRHLYHLTPQTFRLAEICACVQTLELAVCENEERSPKRKAAAETWIELLGDLFHLLPEYEGEGCDLSLKFRINFPPSLFPETHRGRLTTLLAYMAAAAKACIGADQRYSDNYHSVIAYQLMRLGHITPGECVAFHRDVLALPVPHDHGNTCLVYPPDYSADTPPREFPSVSPRSTAIS